MRLANADRVVIFDAAGKAVGQVGRFGNYDGEFFVLHWVALSKSGTLYTAEAERRRGLKFIQ